MRKLIAAINMTIDGFCDHTAAIVDDELHEHYNDLMRTAGLLLYGRTTYQLMESFWPTLVKEPSGNKPMDDFAILMDDIPKIVFSRTLNSVDWKSATLKKELVKEDIIALKQQDGKDIFAGSPSMIVQLTQLGLIDEYQLCVHPIIAGSGLRLFKDISDRIDLTLLKTKQFGSGVIVLYYQPK
ncbi:MAG TPA: dihydrofolate reductase family protein [Candidatus Kapabacteria bacterium]|nr:dihydrofolate reductase family protein [Candidatus Kapabacteria bacterium]